MTTFWFGFVFGFLSVLFLTVTIYSFHAMNVHPERFKYLLRHR